jgi:hypothetical protein
MIRHRRTLLEFIKTFYFIDILSKDKKLEGSKILKNSEYITLTTQNNENLKFRS